MVLINSARPTDKSEIVRLILPIQRDEFSIPISLEDQPDLSDIESCYHGRGGNFWVAREGDQVVGTAALLAIGDHAFALRKMFVHSQYRGSRGNQPSVAQNLLSQALSWAKEQAGSRIYLGTTEAFLAAQKFYLKNGFKEIDRADLPASFPLMKVDSRFFVKELR